MLGAQALALYGGARHAVGLQLQGCHLGGMVALGSYQIQAVAQAHHLHALHRHHHAQQQQHDGQHPHDHTIHRLKLAYVMAIQVPMMHGPMAMVMARPQ